MKLRPDQADALGGPAPCRFTPPEQTRDDGGGGPGPAPKSVIIVDPDKTEGFIGIELVDADQKPVPRVPFVVTLPDGTPVKGNLDQNGKVRIEGIDRGQCTISFPTIDRRDVV